MAETLYQKACRFAGVASDTDRAAFELVYQGALQTVTEVWGVPRMEGKPNFDLLVCKVAAWTFDARGASGTEAEMPNTYIHEAIALRSAYSAGADE